MSGPRWLACLLLAACASGCGTKAPLATGVVDSIRLEQTVIIGHSTKVQVLAQLGPTTNIRFDSGYEVWLYKYVPRNTQQGPQWPFSNQTDERAVEFVILFDPNGVVRKTRRREPPLAADKAEK